MERNKTAERKSTSSHGARKKLKLKIKKKCDADKTLKANVETVFKMASSNTTTASTTKSNTGTLEETSSNTKIEFEVTTVAKNPSKKAKTQSPNNKAKDEVDRVISQKPSKKTKKKKRTSTMSSRRSTTLSSNKTVDSVLNSNLDKECKLSEASVKSILPIANSSLAPWIKQEPIEQQTNQQFNSKTPAKSKTSESSFAYSNQKTVVKTGKQDKNKEDQDTANLIATNIHGSGKVKQMVELVEARMKTSVVPQTPSTVKAASKFPQSSNTKLKVNFQNIKFLVFFRN